MPVFCCVVNQASGIEGQPPTQIKKIQDTQHMPSRSVLILTVPLHFVVIHNCIPDAALYIPDYRLETCRRYYLYETGFLIYSG